MAARSEMDEDATGGEGIVGIAGGGSLGGVSRVGRTPCRDHRRALLVPELRFVLKLDCSMLIALSADA